MSDSGSEEEAPSQRRKPVANVADDDDDNEVVMKPKKPIRPMSAKGRTRAPINKERENARITGKEKVMAPIDGDFDFDTPFQTAPTRKSISNGFQNSAPDSWQADFQSAPPLNQAAVNHQPNRVDDGMNHFFTPQSLQLESQQLHQPVYPPQASTNDIMALFRPAPMMMQNPMMQNPMMQNPMMHGMIQNPMMQNPMMQQHGMMPNQMMQQHGMMPMGMPPQMGMYAPPPNPMNQQMNMIAQMRAQQSIAPNPFAQPLPQQPQAVAQPPKHDPFGGLMQF